jgi:hypothetical protein
MTKNKPVDPCWPPRIQKWKITRLYQDDANHMHNQALINEVAFTLLARCKSMLMVEAARNGQATCPMCESHIEHEARKGAMLACKNCSWAGSWNDYRASMDGLHLIAPGLQPFCQVYVDRLPRAKTFKEKMFWIDWLIHRVHWEGTALPGQPGAVCLIQGRAQDVNDFLADLTASTHKAGSAADLDQYWTPEQHAQIRKWRKASERRASKRKTR